jgi:hypothetical protein
MVFCVNDQLGGATGAVNIGSLAFKYAESGKIMKLHFPTSGAAHGQSGICSYKHAVVPPSNAMRKFHGI